MEKLKVMIVDDEVIQRKNLSEIVENTGMGSVVRTFSNGSLALEWLEHNSVNVVLLDVAIPGNSSLEVLKTIKSQYAGSEVIMLSDGKPGSAEITLEGLKSGALDFIQKFPPADLHIHYESLKNQLLILFSQIKIKMSSFSHPWRDPGIVGSAASPSTERSNLEIKNEKINKFDSRQWKQADLVLIAASTGGPAALEVVCSMFPNEFAKPVLIVQHIPPEFSKALVESLSKKCLLPIAEGQDKEFIQQRNIRIAPGGVHMVAEENRVGEKIIRLINMPHVNGVRPAADVLFKSVARAYKGKNILTVILTGMGNDGMAGVEEIKKNCNCYCIIQSEKSCVVYGMPRSVYEAGLADEVADLKEITPRICKIVAGRS